VDFPHIEETQPQQPSPPIDTGLAGLAMLARFHALPVNADQLAHEFKVDGNPFGDEEILLAAKKLGLNAKILSSALKRLDKIPLPALGKRTDGSYFILARVDGDKALIQSPGNTRPDIVPLDELASVWSGKIILFASRASLVGEASRFDFTWFVPAIVKYRRLLGETLVASFALQIFALVSPLFFQVVMDKVLVHRGLTTLDVLVIGLVVVVVFESLLTGLRAYVFSHTTSRMDVELGSRLFRHLLQLPLAYFQARRVGDSVARVRELENIRSFLTGNVMTLVLDLLFSFVFLGVMLWYSVTLTLVVLASIPVYLLLSLVFTPVIRRRL